MLFFLIAFAVIAGMWALIGLFHLLSWPGQPHTAKQRAAAEAAHARWVAADYERERDAAREVR